MANEHFTPLASEIKKILPIGVETALQTRSRLNHLAMAPFKSLLQKENPTLNALLKQKDGPLTSELLQRPNEFGLGKLPRNLETDATTTSVCGFCSTGCNLNLHLKDQTAVGLTPSTEYPVNIGMACPKGWEALAVLDSPDRASVPLLDGKEVSWQDAADTFCTRMKAVQEEHGKESVAFISTGQIPFEEMEFLGSFAKFGMGVKHGDGNTRQYMAISVVSYKQSFGFDVPPYTY